MSEKREMARLAEGLWENYIKEKWEDARKGTVSYYRATVISNDGEGGITVREPGSSDRTVGCTREMAGVEAGAEVAVLRFGNSNAAKNHVVFALLDENPRLDLANESSGSVKTNGYSFSEIAMKTISGVVIGDKALQVLDCAFADCPSITEVSMKKCVSIGNSAFMSCTELKKATFPECEYIGGSAFAYCSALSRIDFPACKSMGSTFLPAFQMCTALKTVSFPSCEEFDGYNLYDCSTLETIHLNGCKRLNWLSGFGNLKSAYLPVCERMKDYTFARCYMLVELRIDRVSVVTSLGIHVFSSTPIGGYSAVAGNYGSVYVPSSLYASFLTATNWVSISSRIVSV